MSLAITVILEEQCCHYHIQPPKPWNIHHKKVVQGIPSTSIVSPTPKNLKGNETNKLSQKPHEGTKCGLLCIILTTKKPFDISERVKFFISLNINQIS